MIKPMKCFTVNLTGESKSYEGPISGLKFPLYESFKLDGIRGVIHMQRCGSNSQKELPSKYVQHLSKMLPTGLDGEWVYGDPTDESCFSKTQTAVMSIEWPQELDQRELKFYVFDWVLGGVAFDDRLTRLVDWISSSAPGFIVFVEQRVVRSAEHLQQAYENALALGYEGVILKSFRGLYKHGRVTFSNGGAGKLKPYGKELFEARIVDWIPLEVSQRTYDITYSGVEILGHSGTGDLLINAVGAFKVEDVKSGIAFELGGGALMTAFNRVDFVKKFADLKGQLIQYKCMTYGVKDKPRQPTAFRFRPLIDMTEY